MLDAVRVKLILFICGREGDKLYRKNHIVDIFNVFDNIGYCFFKIKIDYILKTKYHTKL